MAAALFFTICLLASGLASDAAAAPAPGPGPGLIHAGGGYTGPGPALVSVQQASSMQHDSAVSIKGSITRYLGRDDYSFADSTGTVEVKIPPHAWMGQYVAEADTVELQGEVKKDREGRTRIHVHRVVKR
jgi:uncharacterized protein (TIGR00156 family)